MASEKNIALKQGKVTQVVELFKDAQGIVLLDYRGLTVAEVTSLRAQFRAAGIHYEVIKNGIVERAAAELGLDGLKPHLVGPSAFAVSQSDPVAPAKLITEFIKKSKKTQIKCGVVTGKVIDAKGVQTLAALPPREVLVARALGAMNAPISGLATVLSGTIRSLLYTLKAIEAKKS